MCDTPYMYIYLHREEISKYAHILINEVLKMITSCDETASCHGMACDVWCQHTSVPYLYL